MSIDVIRVSNTCFKSWTLYGPVDQALKTTCQAESVRVLTLEFATGSAELWTNATDATPDGDINVRAQLLLVVDGLRRQGTTEFAGVVDPFADGGPVIQGTAVITGPGLTSVSGDEALECLRHLTQLTQE